MQQTIIVDAHLHMTPTQCDGYLVGTLETHEQMALDKHLRSCKECREDLEVIQEALRLFNLE